MSKKSVKKPDYAKFEANRAVKKKNKKKKTTARRKKTADKDPIKDLLLY